MQFHYHVTDYRPDQNETKIFNAFAVYVENLNNLFKWILKNAYISEKSIWLDFNTFMNNYIKAFNILIKTITPIRTQQISNDVRYLALKDMVQYINRNLTLKEKEFQQTNFTMPHIPHITSMYIVCRSQITYYMKKIQKLGLNCKPIQKNYFESNFIEFTIALFQHTDKEPVDTSPTSAIDLT